VAELTGTSKRQASRVIKIGKDGVDELKQALDERVITVNEAEKLAGCSPELQRQTVVERRTEKKAPDVPAKIHRAGQSIAQVTKQLASLREKKARPGLVQPDVITRLKDMAAALVQEIAALAMAMAEVATTSTDAGMTTTDAGTTTTDAGTTTTDAGTTTTDAGTATTDAGGLP
jgi:hypothetical protein